VYAAEARVSRNTVLAAFDQLQAEGYLIGRHGSGTFVAAVMPGMMAGVRADPTASGGQRAAGSRFSARGQSIACGTRVPLPAVIGAHDLGAAFQIGLPAVDEFPLEVWRRMYTSRLRRSGPAMMQYGDPAGYAPLREAVASYIVTARGVRCTAEQVVIVTGSQQALEFCGRMLLDVGDPVWLEEPGYLGARAALSSGGARIVPVPVDKDGLDVSAGTSVEPDARMAVVTPSHQFPLGFTMSLERRLALIGWAAAKDAWVIEDDYDSEFRYVGRPLAALQGIDSYRRVIYVGTFSKVLFPSLRLGYMIVPPDLVDGFTAAHLGSDMHPHVVDQAVVAEFMADGHFARHLRRMRSLYAQRQQWLIEAATRLGDRIRLQPSDGGLHLVGWLPTDVDDHEVARQALRHQVQVWPLSQNYLTRAPRPGILLGYAGANRDQILAGIEVLDHVLPHGRQAAT
jgi:GntR family transcriptional regulator/MocR family aminotransferase